MTLLAIAVLTYAGTEGKLTAHGKAFAVSDHIAVTCYHNVEGKSEHTLNGKKCTVIKVVKEYDLAYLKVDEKMKVLPLRIIRGITQITLAHDIKLGTSGSPFIVEGKVLGMVRANINGKGVLVSSELIDKYRPRPQRGE